MMQPRSKWVKPQRNLQVGNIVLLVDDALPRTQWRMGRVIMADPGPDGLVRKVQIKIGNPGHASNRKNTELKILERPVQKLILLLES